MTFFSNLNSRSRIRTPFLRFIFIILGIGIGFEFYKLKDVFDQAFVPMKENAALSFVVRGVLTFIAGLILFLAIFFFETIFMPDHDGGAAASGAAGPGRGRRRRARATKGRRNERG